MSVKQSEIESSFLVGLLLTITVDDGIDGDEV